MLGRLLIKAVLDHGWRPHPTFLAMEDKAHWARDGERSRLYERRAIVFLGMFLEWCYEHAPQLPPDTPPHVPLNLHLSGVRAEDVALRAPRSPLGGNPLFLGRGRGLPGGGPELNISPISTAGGPGIRQIVVEVR